MARRRSEPRDLVKPTPGRQHSVWAKLRWVAFAAFLIPVGALILLLGFKVTKQTESCLGLRPATGTTPTSTMAYLVEVGGNSKVWADDLSRSFAGEAQKLADENPAGTLSVEECELQRRSPSRCEHKRARSRFG